MRDIKAGKIIRSDIGDKAEKFTWVPMTKEQATDRVLHEEFILDLDHCPCDECAGGCDELNPTCGDCFLCEAKADDDKWWAINRADVLQI
jgi:hypothetical protein